MCYLVNSMFLCSNNCTLNHRKRGKIYIKRYEEENIHLLYPIKVPGVIHFLINYPDNQSA